MPVQRGIVPPALIITTIALVLCSIGWGAFGVFSFAEPDGLALTAHRYLSLVLSTATICAVMINLAARIVRVIRAAGADDGYAAGYADGLDARPAAPTASAVSRLVRTPR